VESIGDRLKQAREAKKLTIKTVALDTNMSPTYIEALEVEDFDKFPGETYIIGFLKTYSEYLKLDPEEMVMLYKGYKIGESATPLEELTRPTRSQFVINILALYERYRNLVFFGGVAFVSVLIAWGLWTMNRSDVSVDEYDTASKIKKSYEESQKSSITNIKSLQLSNDKGFTLVYKGEAVQFLVDNKEVVFLLKEIGDNKVTVNFLNNDKDIVMEIDKQVPVTLAECPREILLTLKGLTESRAKVMIDLGRDLKAEMNAAAALTGNTDVKPLTDGDNTKVIAQSNKSLKIVFEVKFIQKSFIEIYLDGNRKQRGFMPAGSVERWEASEYIQMKIGNAGGIKSTINGKEFVFGKPGQVANKIITWKKDVTNPNLYHIDVKDW
jgi:transcriptional regulator with XRE-family HTH domain